MSNQLDQAIVKIARNIDSHIGWYAANYFCQEGVIDEYERDLLTGLLEWEGPLTLRQAEARRRINERILTTYSALDFFSLGIDVDDLSIAKNGWWWKG